ncbi:MAG: hypothetical protein H2212_15165 [Ruminococcus sp.]|nr:hypothetical protein [Ruminococcus sp.]
MKDNWDDGNYMEWADQERLVRQDIEEIESSIKQTFIIRCSDGWMRSHHGTYQEAMIIAQNHVSGSNKEYVIV